jgi:hypothetical protein
VAGIHATSTIAKADNGCLTVAIIRGTAQTVIISIRADLEAMPLQVTMPVLCEPEIWAPMPVFVSQVAPEPDSNRAKLGVRRDCVLGATFSIEAARSRTVVSNP